MKNCVGSAMAFVAFCGLFPAKAVDAPFAGDCAFYCSFDNGDLMADLSEGEPEAMDTLGGKKPVFVENGVRGKAMRFGGEEIPYLSFPAKDNFSPARPGTLSMWIQPVKWRRGDELPEYPGNPDLRDISYTLFFYIEGNGSMGVERMTSPYHKREKPLSLDSMLVYYRVFPKLKDLTASVRMEWADGEWHHVALTWTREEVCLYLDGKQEGPPASLSGGIEPESDPNRFNFGSYGDPSLIDEVALYNRALSPEEIKTLFDAYEK